MAGIVLSEQEPDEPTRTSRLITSRRGVVIGGVAAAGTAMSAFADAAEARRCRRGQRRCGGRCRRECGAERPRRPFPQRSDYGAVRPRRWTQDELDDHVRAAYDRWKARYLVAAGKASDGTRLFRVALGKPGTANQMVTVSEGQGFGMMIVGHMAGHDPEARTVFDGLRRFTRAHPSAIDSRLMAWRIPDGMDSAFDGDCDIAYGLLVADAQWGSAGAVDYRREFSRVAAGIAASTIGPRSRLPMLGDWVSPNGDRYNQDTVRTSDFMPGHFRAFGRATGDPIWSETLNACGAAIDLLQAEYSPQTGLLPDFAEPVSASDRSPRPASAGFLEGARDGDYGYNAGRVPWRLGIDALVNDAEPSAARVVKISRWAREATAGNPRAFRAGYRLDGSPLPNSDYLSTFFIAPLGVAAMSDGNAQDWLNAVYATVYDATDNYYEDSVTLLCLLAMTGNFWDPGP